jgi:hypothetical protein
MVAYIDPDFCWGRGRERSKREGGRNRRQRSNVGRGREKKRKREMKLNGELKSSDDGRDGKRSRQQSLAWRTFLVAPAAAISGAPLDSDNAQAAGCWQLKPPLHTVTVADVRVTVTARVTGGWEEGVLLTVTGGGGWRGSKEIAGSVRGRKAGGLDGTVPQDISALNHDPVAGSSIRGSAVSD